MRTLAMINQKGGCGKTTTAINLSAALAEQGEKVLLVDLDPQAHATLGLGVNPDFLIESVYDLFSNSDRQIRDIVIPISENLDLAAAKFSLVLTERLLGDSRDREKIVRRALEPCADVYDFVIIDCPPNVGTLTLNALTASDEAMAILETSFFSLHGISRLLETLGTVRKALNPDITVSVVATLFDRRTRFARDVLEEIRTHFAGKMYETVIRTCVRLREATSAGLPIHCYDPHSKGNADYTSLAGEVIRRRQSVSADDVSVEEESIAAAAGVASDGDVKQNAEAEPVVTVDGGPPLDSDSPTADSIAAWAENERPPDDLSAAPHQNQALEEDSDLESPAAKEEHSAVGTIDGDLVLPDAAGPGPVSISGGVLFTLDSPDAKDVRLVGDFNAWNPSSTNMVKDPGSGMWKALVPLEDGRFEYRYLVDGNWTEDPANPLFVVSEYGGKNSVLILGQHAESETRLVTDHEGRDYESGAEKAHAADAR